MRTTWVKLCHMTIQVTSSAVLSHALFMTLYKQIRTIKSVYEIMLCDHSSETSSEVRYQC